ncbi:MAG: hypothetical protein GX442_16940 [Candidatus Riflebacteria bacterium]|nr:hypothetical protein [Candidatus Riflebacteria bacterium]
MSAEKNGSLRSRRGAVTILAALAVFFMLGMTALVTDVGWMFYTNARIQTAVNAGWKAGFDRMREICDTRFTTPSNLTTTERAEINRLVVAVINLNLAEGKRLPADANVVTSWDPFTVAGVTNEPLFFATIWGKQDFSATSDRSGPVDDVTYLPIGQPFGPTKDLGPKFDWDPFIPSGPGNTFTASDGYRVGIEYILKLGSGTAGVPIDNTSAILVPMAAGDQTEDNTSPYMNDTYLRAYGVAMWCLSDGGGDLGFTPVYWLCGYRGGAFLLPNKQEVINKLTEAPAVNYEVITGLANVNAILAAVGSNVIELYNKPRIAVYSSQRAADPVELVLKACRIPYGTYRPGRYAAFNPALCVPLYDQEILDGVLNQYNWLHMHHEDFTGFTGGCYDNRIDDTCYTQRTTLNGTTKDNTKLCSYCRNFYYGWIADRAVWAVTAASWGSSSGGDRTRTVRRAGSATNYSLTWTPRNCQNWGVRCSEKASYTGQRWWDIDTDLLCYWDADKPMCRSAKAAYELATANGFTDGAGYDYRRKWVAADGTLIDGNGAVRLPTATDMIRKPSRVQRMKFQVVDLVRQHVASGGYLYAQCFAPETYDMALWQRRTYLDQLADPSVAAAYDDCLAFTGFSYRGFCVYGNNSMYYSSINSTDYDDFTLTSTTDPRCQIHAGSNPNFSHGHCDAFSVARLKPGITKLGRCTDNSYVPYIKGTLGTGEFCFGGGHFHNNCQSRRLVANNILLGALSSKQLEGGNEVVYPGREKKNFGIIDPDNTLTGSTASDYQNQLTLGYSGALNIGDRTITVGDNLATETSLGVNERLATPTTRFVIVPIVDIPPEVLTGQNATAACIYDVGGSGTDDPNGTFDPASHTFTSAVRIIGYAKFELLDPSEYTRVGDNIASGDVGDLGYYTPGQIRGRFVEYIIRPGEISVPY